MSKSTAEAEPAILVNVWFDVRCPWCYLGKHRLERAVELFAAGLAAEGKPDVPVTISHHSFELAPGIAERFEGSEADYMLRYEGVPHDQTNKTLPALQSMAADEGVQLRFDELQLVNTRKAHRVFQQAQRRGVGEEVLERLFTGYFAECRDLADPDTLATLAAEGGLDRAEALAAVHDDDLDEAVEADEVRARMLGASGVPYALVNAKYSISGGQRAEIFASALRTVAEREFGIPAGQHETS